MNETSPIIQSVVPVGGFLDSAKATDHLVIGSAAPKIFSNLPSERESSCEDANYSRSDDGFKQSSLRDNAVSVYLARQRNEVEKITKVINQIISGCTPGQRGANVLPYYAAKAAQAARRATSNRHDRVCWRHVCHNARSSRKPRCWSNEKTINISRFI
jgi:hypothetical protein